MKQQNSEGHYIQRWNIYIENQMAMTFTSFSISTSYGIRWQWIQIFPNDSPTRTMSLLMTWCVRLIPFICSNVQHKCSKHKEYFPSRGNTTAQQDSSSNIVRFSNVSVGQIRAQLCQKTFNTDFPHLAPKCTQQMCDSKYCFKTWD